MNYSLNCSTLGQSVQGRSILAYTNFKTQTVQLNGRFESPRKVMDTQPILILGGIHGDERATVYLVENFCSQLSHIKKAICLIPCANPDAWALNQRNNYRGIDMNRNFPANFMASTVNGKEPLSEPESQLLAEWIIRNEPQKIISLHWALSEIDPDGEQSEIMAKAMWLSLNSKDREAIPIKMAQMDSEILPGSLGGWCGYQLRYRDGSRPSIVTLELPYDWTLPKRPIELLPQHWDQVQSQWRENPTRYLRKINPLVHQMFRAVIDLE